METARTKTGRSFSPNIGMNGVISNYINEYILNKTTNEEIVQCAFS